MTSQSARPLLVTALCAAAVSAALVGGKATRDALFLTSLDASTLPGMLIVAAVVSILLVVIHSRAAGRINPAVLVPASFAVSGTLFVLEWLVRPSAPSATAVAVYLHVSAAGPLLASGFWLVAGERFDPRTAKARFGQIGGAGTLGGLFGALISERVAVHFGAPGMLLVLGGLQYLAGWLVWRLADRSPSPSRRAGEATDTISRTPFATRLRVIAEAPHLRDLMALVLLGTTGAAMVEFLFKTRAVDTFGPGDGLLRFFALFYGATSLVSFVVQVLGSSAVLRRSGLALSVSAPSIALLAGSLGGLLSPGFGSLLVARAGESIFRTSWFRAGYEQFFTPIHPAEKRIARPFIDVALDRLGDAIGGGIIRLVIVFAPLAHASVLLSLAVVCSVGAIIAASHLNRWYLRTLETSLIDQGGAIDWATPTEGLTVRMPTVFRRYRTGRSHPVDSRTMRSADAISGSASRISTAVEAELADIRLLHIGTRERIAALLSRQEGIGPTLVAHVIPLLSQDAIADHAMFALRKVAEDYIGALIDALIDPNHSDVIRRRLARVFSVCVSQRAADGLMLALDDSQFDVRFQAARSLVAIAEKNPRIRIDASRIEQVVLHEVAVGKPIWEGRRLLAGLVSESPLDGFVKDRAGQSLAHVFTLLSLVLPREPLQIAFRSLNSSDDRLRGTALEYLEGVLSPAIRRGLWTFVAPEFTPSPAAIPPDASVTDLLRASASPAFAGLVRQQG